MRCLVILMLIIGMASSSPAGMPVKAPVYVDHITVQTNATGYFSHLTGTINGELQCLEYVNGNFTGPGNITLRDIYGVQLDRYNISTGSSYRSIGSQHVGSSDAWGPYVISTPLWLNMTDQQDNCTAEVLLMYR